MHQVERIRIMSDEIKDCGGDKRDKNDGKDPTEGVVSVARRQAMKVGLTAIPVILTLRGKPLSGQDLSPSAAASMAAGSSLST
jgi:hypothetical protein